MTEELVTANPSLVSSASVRISRARSTIPAWTSAFPCASSIAREALLSG